MASAIIPSRRVLLDKLRCSIFQTSYNPTGIRTGAKYLRARLRGPSMMKYYPPEFNMSTIARKYPELEVADEYEQQRFQDVIDKKRRGKGAPKKAKSKGQYIILPELKPHSNNYFQTSLVAHNAREDKYRILFTHALPLLCYYGPSATPHHSYPPMHYSIYTNNPHCSSLSRLEPFATLAKNLRSDSTSQSITGQNLPPGSKCTKTFTPGANTTSRLL